MNQAVCDVVGKEKRKRKPQGERTHQLIRHLGIKNYYLSVSERLEPIRLRKDDLLLFCSDGLSDMLNDEELFGVLKTGECIEALGTGLVNAALENGGRDNVTAIITKIN